MSPIFSRPWGEVRSAAWSARTIPPFSGVNIGWSWKRVENRSYLKSPYYKPLGYPGGIYRVGPAARLNVCNGCGTPLADQEWAEFRDLAMNRGVLQVAKRFITGPEAPEGAFNRVEAVIRAFDPCLSCSTHTLGGMPLVFRFARADGTVIAEIPRDRP